MTISIRTIEGGYTMKTRWIPPILMISLGLNLLFGYQNCGQVDPAFVYNEVNGSSKIEVDEVKEKVPTSYLRISKVKVLKSDLVRLQRNVAYDFTLEFRTKYTNDYIGVEPIVTKPLEVKDSKGNTLAKIKLDDVQILEKECVESVDKNQIAYFDCKYAMKIDTDLDLSIKSLSKQKYSLTNSTKGIEFEMSYKGKTVTTKTFKTAINYVDKYVPEMKSTTKKLQANLPSTKSVAKRKSAMSGKKLVLDTKPAKKLPMKKKMIEGEPKLVEGVYCHIRVLNPPHLEILSDVKKVGTYYEDADTCREVAIKLSKTYCGHSLMGELDINWSVKDRTKDGEKILQKEIESIECAM
jgi:hypothetical protein